MKDEREPELKNEENVSISKCKTGKHTFEIILTGFIDPKNPRPFLGEGDLPRQIRWCSTCGAISLDIWFNSNSQRKESGYASVSIEIPQVSK